MALVCPASLVLNIGILKNKETRAPCVSIQDLLNKKEKKKKCFKNPGSDFKNIPPSFPHTRILTINPSKKLNNNLSSYQAEN